MTVALVWIVDVGVYSAFEDCLVVERFDGGFVCRAGEMDVLAFFCKICLLYLVHSPRNHR